MTTTSRSDFTWPYLAQRQRIFDWDRYEYKEWQQPSFTSDLSSTPPPFQNAETLGSVPGAEKLLFDFDGRPKPIVGHQQPFDRYPTEKAIEYDKYNADARSTVRRTRPRVFKCPQISLDDVPADRQDMVCDFVYCTSKTMAERTSGVPEGRPIFVDVPSKPFGDPGKFQLQPLYETINPTENWRRVSIKWDESQKRIFGGRSVD